MINFEQEYKDMLDRHLRWKKVMFQEMQRKRRTAYKMAVLSFALGVVFGINAGLLIALLTQ